jgi:hypothetical protein
VNVTFLFLINAGRVPVSILHVFSWSLDSLALRAAAFHLAVRAGGALRAAFFQLAVGAGVAHLAAAFLLAVRGGVARAAQLLFILP